MTEISNADSANAPAAHGMSGWAWVLLAGFFEVGFTVALKLAQQNSNYNIAFLICAIASFECLARGIKTVPLSIAYAVWTGIGSVGALVAGVVAFDEPLGLVRGLLVGGLIAALVALKLVAPKPAGTA